MFEKVKLNVLIPLEYNREDFDKTLEPSRENTITREERQRLKESIDSSDWFHCCFRSKPIEKTFQLNGSPLLEDEGPYQMSRMELDSVMRTSVGIQNNENAVYTLDGQSDISFMISKVHILFTRSRVAFLHLEILGQNLSDGDTRTLVSSFSNIVSTMPKMNFERRISRDESEAITVSFKEVINNIIALQTYIPLGLYRKEIEPFIQICLIGSCDTEDKWIYFNSIQALAKFPNQHPIENERVYKGGVKYIIRFAGSRTVCVYGDTKECRNGFDEQQGKKNHSFLTGDGGLVKSATENYTTVYAFLVSLWLLARKKNALDPDMNYLENVPEKLTNEDNIELFYNQCIWDTGWKLKEVIRELEHKRRFLEHIRLLKTYLETEKEALQRQSRSEDLDEEQISSFTKKASLHIDDTISQYEGDDICRTEKKGMMMLFGDKWGRLLLFSQKSLVSAGVLLKSCEGFHDTDFDFSGVCICVTAALEAELKRVFFTGFLSYMVARYGEPCNKNAEVIYEYWPEELLTVAHRHFNPKNSTLKKTDKFAMGRLPYLFGEKWGLSNKDEVRKNQEEQSQMMQERMSEYLKEIVNVDYHDNPLEQFYVKVCKESGITSKKGSFVWKCEQIRKDYRNKAAHLDDMREQQAKDCYRSVVGKADMYVLQAEITGVLLELCQKVDFDRVDTIIRNPENLIQPIEKPLDRSGMPDSFAIGQTVKLTNLKRTQRGSLRGLIFGSDVKASLSNNHLLEAGIDARQYEGKTIKVTLTRWNENAGIFNAEWVGKE